MNGSCTRSKLCEPHEGRTIAVVGDVYRFLVTGAGRAPFNGAVGIGGLPDAKRTLEHRLGELLPPEVAGSELLVGLCRRLVAADPEKRFPDAEAADLGRKGAAAFHRQLVKGDLASEYGNDLRVWLDALGPAPVK